MSVDVKSLELEIRNIFTKHNAPMSPESTSVFKHLIEYRNTDEETILVLAIKSQNFADVKLILEFLRTRENEEIDKKKVQEYLQAKNKIGAIPIGFAAFRGDFEMLELFVESMIVIGLRREDIFESLVQPSVVANKKIAIISSAASLGLEKIVDYIVKNCHYSLQALAENRLHNNCHILHHAIARNSEKGLDYILKTPELRHLMDVESSSVLGTPLLTASLLGNSIAVRKLIDNGANFNAKFEICEKYRGRTLLEVLRSVNVESEQYKKIKESFGIVQSAHDLERHLKDDKLCYKLRCCDSLTLKTNFDSLLEKGASVNQKDAEGNTPWHLILQQHDDTVLGMIQNMNPDPFVKNNRGMNIFDVLRAISDTPSEYGKSFRQQNKYMLLFNLYSKCIKKYLQNSKYNQAAEFIMQGFLDCSPESAPACKAFYYLEFCKFIKDEAKILELIGTKVLIALYKLVPKNESYSRRDRDPYGEAQLELANIFYMAYADFRVRQKNIESTSIVKLQKESLNGQLEESTDGSLEESLSAPPKEHTILMNSEVGKKFQELLNIDENDSDPSTFLKKAFLHICEANTGTESEKLRIEITGSYLDVGMRGNSLDLRKPDDLLKMLEQFKEQSSRLKEKEDQIKAQQDKIQKLELELRSFRKESLKLELEEPGSEKQKLGTQDFKKHGSEEQTVVKQDSMQQDSAERDPGIAVSDTALRFTSAKKFS